MACLQVCACWGEEKGGGGHEQQWKKARQGQEGRRGGNETPVSPYSPVGPIVGRTEGAMEGRFEGVWCVKKRDTMGEREREGKR